MIAAHTFEELAGLRFDVVLADPPWRFKLRSPKGAGRAADRHYATLPIEAICALPIAAHVNHHAVLYLWATPPLLIEALRVVEAWGFEYKTQAVWIKRAIAGQIRMGLGYWFRAAHEILILATRGQPKAPAPKDRAKSVVNALVGAHSAKPAKVCALIEKYHPQAAKLELFRRGPPRPGWSCFGDEIELAAAVDKLVDKGRKTRRREGAP